MMSYDLTAELRFSSLEGTQLSLEANTVVVEDEVMADLPVLTSGNQRLVGLCPSASSDAQASQPPVTIPDRNDSLVGPILLATASLLCPSESEISSKAFLTWYVAVYFLFPD